MGLSEVLICYPEEKPMSDSYVTIENDGPIAIVTFDRKTNLNAFDQKLMIELLDVARSFHDDLETRVVILTGSKDLWIQPVNATH